jgi:hypothetical protein
VPHVATRLLVTTLAVLSAAAPLAAQQLTVRLVGNAGVLLSDGTTSLLVDLPYESGAFGYDHYDLAALHPAGTVVAVVTHHHRDHFAAELFLPQRTWRVIGPPSAVAGIPAARVIDGDSVTVGRFAVVAIRTPHTPDHRSYRIRWLGRTLHFTGDTEAFDAVRAERQLDLRFITPWLQCRLVGAGHAARAERVVLYHLQPNGRDRVCGTPSRLRVGERVVLGPGDA